MPGFLRNAWLPRTACAAWLLSSCAALPYPYEAAIEGDDTLQLRPGEAQIVRGRPSAFLDGVGHYVVSLPSKLILWDWDVDRHEISPETEAALARYLADNGLANVKVRLNQYAPGDEWRRLFRNKAIHGFWRYTFGILTVTFYTIFPQRFFGGDNYNPFTNTISIYSDEPAILLHEGGHAKDFAQREWKGAYAAARIIPLVDLYHEGKATSDAIGYTIDKRQSERQKDAYEILYPAFGTYVAGEGGRWFPLGYLESLALSLAGALPGHVAGRIAAARVEDAPPDPSPQPVE